MRKLSLPLPAPLISIKKLGHPLSNVDSGIPAFNFMIGCAILEERHKRPQARRFSLQLKALWRQFGDGMISNLFKRAEDSLNGALATNDLGCICRAIDAELRTSGIQNFALKAGVDRATLYRAFRLENGPTLEIMVKTLHALGLQLVVETRLRRDVNTVNRVVKSPTASISPEIVSTAKAARALTIALRSGDLHRAVGKFAQILQTQQNVSEFARRTIRSRETLYRSFTPPSLPRFSTLLSVLNALGGMQFAVRRLPSGRRHYSNDRCPDEE